MYDRDDRRAQMFLDAACNLPLDDCFDAVHANYILASYAYPLVAGGPLSARRAIEREEMARGNEEGA